MLARSIPYADGAIEPTHTRLSRHHLNTGPWFTRPDDIRSNTCQIYLDRFREGVGLVLVGCWAHARRKFFDAEGTSKKAGAADQAIAMIAQLYRIEKELSRMPSEQVFRTARTERVKRFSRT